MIYIRILGMLIFYGLFWVIIPGDCAQLKETPVSQIQNSTASNETPVLPSINLEQASDKKNKSSYRLEKIKEWRDAVCTHTMGEADTSAKIIGIWPEVDLDLVVDYMTKLAAQSTDTVKRFLTKETNRSALGLTEQEAKEGNIKRLLKQGILLHTDIALLTLAAGKTHATKRKIGVFIDGKVVVTFSPPDHLGYARQLLAAAFNSQPKDETKQWYVTTIAYLQWQRLLFCAEQNIKSALDLFPLDEQILFYAGTLHETLASPLLQNTQIFLKENIFSKSREDELKLAIQYFEKAVVINPNFAEARLHLGRVLGLLDRHQESVAALKAARSAINDPKLLYYTLLNLGHEMKMLAHFDEASELYEQALLLFPTAQSPLLALGQLAHVRNDIKGEQRWMQQMFLVKRDNSMTDDPWWTYSISHVSDTTIRMEDLYKKYGEPMR
jgi:tetratricopeptide (TPR) repeat protein